MDDAAWIREKLEQVEAHVGDIKVTLALNTHSLQVHMARTELLESRVEPLEKHAAMFAGAVKAVAVLGAAAATGLGLLATILKLLGQL